ncbi:hypothetical protein D9611_013144 [Ephemerocybe angulata]|uniref:Uncharacterized protein n=1 Tax=Ephemerocybe angulata TaxID=980116 RepID=A0A8H5FBZ8_9AGAR|nr:hypothetical protein D9611_013144 [Tulosesus angulatus]
MKVTPASILLGILSLSTCASAYLEYNELDARDYTNSLLVERNAVEVPFQHSLRSFLEEAADAYRRALDDHEDLLEARANVKYHLQIYLNGVVRKTPTGGDTVLKVSPADWDAEQILPEYQSKNPGAIPPGSICHFHLSRPTGPKVPNLATVEDKLVVFSCWLGKTEPSEIKKVVDANHVELNFMVVMNGRIIHTETSRVTAKMWTPANAQEVLVPGAPKGSCKMHLGTQDGRELSSLNAVWPHSVVVLVCTK